MKANYKYLFILFFVGLTLKALPGANKTVSSDKQQMFINDSVKIQNYIKLSDEIQNTDPVKALKYIDSAMVIINERHNDNFLMQNKMCLNIKGIIYTKQGDYLKGIEYYQKSLLVLNKIQLQNPDNVKQKKTIEKNFAIVYINIGILYFYQKNYTTAIEYFNKSLTVFDETGDIYGKAMVYNNIGMVYFETIKYDSALMYYFNSLNIFKELDIPSKVAMCCTNIGEVYGEQGLYEKALHYLQKSMAIKKQLNDNFGLGLCLLSIAKIENKIGDYSKSVNYAKKSLSFNSNVGNNEAVRDIYGLLAKNYEALSDYKMAYKYLMEFKKINDSIFSIESKRKLIEMQTKYETQNKEAQLLILQQNQIHQQFIKKILIAGLVFVVVASIIIVMSIISKRKKDKIISIKEKQLMQIKLEKQEIKAKEMRKEIEFKTKQLTTHALNMMQKNKILADMTDRIDEITKEVDLDTKQKLRQLKQQIKQNLKTKKDWDIFKIYFEQVNSGFFDSLLKINPSLNTYEFRHSALIKLNMNIKESASVLNLSPHTVKSARYRLKKKLHLRPGDSLSDFIRNI
jgi:tetratricopeptide (TPR) repeat protein